MSHDQVDLVNFFFCYAVITVRVEFEWQDKTAREMDEAEKTITRDCVRVEQLYSHDV
jgi:hypothetical protein